MTDLDSFEFTDIDGDVLTITPFNRDLHPNLNMLHGSFTLMVNGNEGVHLDLEALDDLRYFLVDKGARPFTASRAHEAVERRNALHSARDLLGPDRPAEAYLRIAAYILGEPPSEIAASDA